MANQIALAIDDALNFEALKHAHAELGQKTDELQRERDRLKLLLEVNNKVILNLNLRDLLRSISASIRLNIVGTWKRCVTPYATRLSARYLAAVIFGISTIFSNHR